jgi:hypothetical protein
MSNATRLNAARFSIATVIGRMTAINGTIAIGNRVVIDNTIDTGDTTGGTTGGCVITDMCLITIGDPMYILASILAARSTAALIHTDTSIIFMMATVLS